jgi:hypothetical protein
MIEFSALARQYLHRRIPTITQLEQEILSLRQERDAKHIKINWQFSIQSARTKLNSHYSAIKTDNKKFADS